MDTESFLRHLQSLLWYQGQIVHLERVPVRRSKTATLNPPLDERLSHALAATGVSSLYPHQVEAIQALREGRNVIVATPAASGVAGAAVGEDNHYVLGELLGLSAADIAELERDGAVQPLAGNETRSDDQ